MIEQPINPPVLEAAGTLINRHDLRTLDAIQLGSAIVARDLMSAADMRLIASDKALLDAARKEGFETWNPPTSRAHRAPLTFHLRPSGAPFSPRLIAKGLGIERADTRPLLP